MTLFRVAGIPVRLHPTFLLLVGGWFAHATWRYGLDAALRAAGSLAVLFGAVLLHELGHALVAARHGVRTRSITLTPIGGTARLDARSVPAAVDLRVSVAGPAVNLALAALALGADRLIGLPALRMPGLVNLALGLLNLVPVFPLDGGRALRAGLVGWIGFPRANTLALGVGFALAVALGVAGVALGQIGLTLFAVLLALLQWRERTVQALLRRHPEWA